jgi:glycosyltransferase involved in cell wall biosynthesis
MSNSTKNLVIILDPRGTIIKGGKSVIERHQLYAKALKESSPQSQLLVISKEPLMSSLNSKDNQRATLEFQNVKIGPFYLLRYFCKSRQFIKSNKESKVLLIAGDPWFSFYIAQAIRFTVRPFPGLQVQVHGDIFDKNWKQLQFRNYIKSELAKFSMRSAKNIRVNTELQASAVSSKVGSSKVSISVAPVPFSIPRTFVHEVNGTTRPRSIGFVGRLHRERGTSEFVRLVKRLPLKQMGLDVYVVGEGSDRANLETALKSFVDGQRIFFLGNLSGQDLEQVWQRIGIAIFTAPSESYGLAMRESLVRGVPIWTFPTVGALELLQSLPKEQTESVRIIDASADQSELESWLEKSLNTKVPEGVKSRLLLDRSVGLQSLVDSWLQQTND